MDYAMPRQRPNQLPAVMYTWPTPPTHLPPVLEEPELPEGAVPSRQSAATNLGFGGQQSNVGQLSMNSWAYSETGWATALNQAVQRDADFVDEWQRSIDMLLIFVRTT